MPHRRPPPAPRQLVAVIILHALLCPPVLGDPEGAEQGQGGTLGRVEVFQKDMQALLRQQEQLKEEAQAEATAATWGAMPQHLQFVQDLEDSGRWIIRRQYQGMVGATVAVDKQGYGCFLLLEDVCHFNLPGRGDSINPGYWYSLRGANLDSIVSDEDVCFEEKRGVPWPWTTGTHHWTSLRRKNRVTTRFGKFLSEEAAERVMGGRPRVRERKGSTEVLTGVGGVEHVLRHRNKALALMSPHDSVAGHFSERVGSLAEISAGLHDALRLSPDKKGLLSDIGNQLTGGDLSTVLFFGRELKKRVHHYGQSIARILFGENAQLMAGRERPFSSHECFPLVIYPLNVFHTIDSAQRFTRHAHEWAGREAKRKNYMDAPRRPPGQPYPQVTWVWRSKKRFIANRGEVLAALMGELELPVHVVEFRGNLMEEIVQTMQRTRVLFGMHGGGFSNIPLLPEGAVIIEVLPYKFTYAPYRLLASSFGLHLYQWSAARRNLTLYDNGCFTPDLDRMSVQECDADLKCRECIKDHAIVTVDLPEFVALLRTVKIRL